MIIYPAIQLQKGRCVSLHRGRLDEPDIWHVDPLAKAQGFAEAGAHAMLVTDLDAVDGSGNNRALIESLIHGAALDVMVAGGIRSLERVREWLDAGAARVAIGTAAVADPALVRKATKYHPDQIVLAVDVFQGRVMSRGWRETSAFAPEDFIAHFAELPLAGVLITDIDADVGDTDAVLALVTRLAGLCDAPVIASGIVRGIDDIARLKYVSNVAGAVVGRALFNRTVDLGEAIELAEAAPEPTAEFL